LKSLNTTILKTLASNYHNCGIWLSHTTRE